MASPAFTVLLWQRVNQLLDQRGEQQDWLKDRLRGKNKNTLTRWFGKKAGPTRIAEIAELAAALEVDLVELLRLEGPQEPPAVRQLELPFGEDSSVAYLEIECVKSALIIRPARIQRGR